jgi:hypothetical protein
MDGFWKWLGTGIFVMLLIVLPILGFILFGAFLIVFLVHPAITWVLVMVGSIIMIFVGLYCWYKWEIL